MFRYQRQCLTVSLFFVRSHANVLLYYTLERFLCRRSAFRFPKGILPLSAPAPKELEHLPVHYLAELTFEEVCPISENHGFLRQEDRR